MSERLNDIVKSVSDLSDTEMEELFKILHINKCEYTQNNNGIFINLSWQNEDILNIIEKYIRFCKTSRVEVSKYQSMCDVLNKKMETSRNESLNEPLIDLRCENESNDIAIEPIEDDTNPVKIVSRISSSMRFYLLKKKFAKLAPAYDLTMQSDLGPEMYLIR